MKKLWTKRARVIYALGLHVMRTYDLHTVNPGSAEKRKNSGKMVTRSPEAKSLQWSNFLCVFLWSAIIDFFQIFPTVTDNFLIFLAVLIANDK